MHPLTRGIWKRWARGHPAGLISCSEPQGVRLWGNRRSSRHRRRVIDRPASPAALQHVLVGRSDSAHETQALPAYGMRVPAAARGLGWGSGVCGLSPLPLCSHAKHIPPGRGGPVAGRSPSSSRGGRVGLTSALPPGLGVPPSPPLGIGEKSPSFRNNKWNPPAHSLLASSGHTLASR